MSPGWPQNYPPNHDCYWGLHTRPGKKIQLLFYTIDIEPSSNCEQDYLTVSIIFILTNDKYHFSD